MVGKHDMTINVPTHEWTEHFEKKLKFVDIPNILDYHHFVLSSSEKGVVLCSRRLGDTPEKVSIIGKVPITSELPPVVKPRGLSQKRKEYLFTDIREFCTEETKDITAPDPSNY